MTKTKEIMGDFSYEINGSHAIELARKFGGGRYFLLQIICNRGKSVFIMFFTAPSTLKRNEKKGHWNNMINVKLTLMHR